MGYTYQLIRFARASSNLNDFNYRNKALTAKLLRQGYRYFKLRKAFSKFYRRHSALLEKYSVSLKKKVREKTRECHNHKPQPFPDRKRKRKPTNLNKHKPSKRTKSTKISSLFPKRGNRNTKRTEKHKNKMTHGKTYNKSPRRINPKATRSKTNTGTTALERSVEQTMGGGGGLRFKAHLQPANFTNENISATRYIGTRILRGLTRDVRNELLIVL